ncbi:MAG TPA: glycosyltransferase family 2 protein [Gemmatimonadaceae bacterium]
MKGLIVVVNYEQELEIARFLRSLASANPGLDVIVVDDGSRDESPRIAESLGYRVIRHNENRGVGATIRTGIDFARGEQRFDYVVIMSSNGKMHADELPVVIGPIIEGRADYVQGSRFLSGGQSPGLSTFRGAAIPLFSIFASAILRRRFSDITCGYRAYRLSIFDDPAINLDQSWLDRYELELYIHYFACQKARVVEVPVTIDYSHLASGRKSKMRPIVGWWSMIRPFVLLTTGVKH